ncbi:hypothetical protein SAMN04489737_0993 [Arcanobacterium phocae]|uniref:Uncharacterized protein n=1 Tax=Arcanobacterium phocae TaxID=131112 RepID=A0A1H2LG03_9ACTO|nr:hypothetical protein [Arcanobacterium phocae]SDU79772.1 hypothetical protein SAMN04489737_0993 [Arcanobacterium phocae]
MFISRLKIREHIVFAGTKWHARERGDVPGWVMITLMTAALVVLLWSVVGPALTSLFENAISRITEIS